MVYIVTGHTLIKRLYNCMIDISQFSNLWTMSFVAIVVLTCVRTSLVIIAIHIFKIVFFLNSEIRVPGYCHHRHISPYVRPYIHPAPSLIFTRQPVWKSTLAQNLLNSCARCSMTAFAYISNSSKYDWYDLNKPGPMQCFVVRELTGIK